MKEKMAKEISFVIDHLDPMGQGVSKQGDDIFFIAKTLPGEEGTAHVYKSSKGVHFAKVVNISKQSPLRRKSPCPHYDDCGACHYLHTSYDEEVIFKQRALAKSMQKIYNGTIELITADEQSRLGHRNRVQLHYQASRKKLGLIKGQLAEKKYEILPIPNCLLPRPQVMKELKNLYQDQNWLQQVKLLAGNRDKGHVELYQQEQNDHDKVQVSWNKSYADGGFSQINYFMNLKLKAKIKECFQKSILNDQNRSLTILDLFGGNGNLGRELVPSESFVVDCFIDKKQLSPHQKGLILNLENPASIKLIKDEMGEKSPELIIINPPRGGMKNVDVLLQHFSPRYIFYVSCNPMTLARDLAKIKDHYHINNLTLVDLFPSTFHFETFAFLTRLQ